MKVVKLLDKYTYVIDEGTFEGIKKGQKCYIYCVGEEIIDPSTKVSLGYLEIPKVYCTVTHAQDHISVIQSDDAPSPLMGFTIKLNYDYFEKSISEEEKKVKIGDYVKMVLG